MCKQTSMSPRGKQHISKNTENNTKKYNATPIKELDRNTKKFPVNPKEDRRGETKEPTTNGANRKQVER